MSLQIRSLLTLVLCLSPATAFAQSITTTPVAPVPLGSPWLIVALGMMLVGGVWWMLGRRALAGTGARAVALAVVVALSAVYVLNAQATVTFTDPSGETLSIPINPELSVDDVTGWEPADFTNTSGVDLLITAIVTPTFAECVPGGLDGVLMAGSSDPSPHPLCEVNETLASGATCRVDVETICRAEAVDAVAMLASIAPTAGPAAGGTSVTLTGTNLAGATSVTFDGVAATSVVIIDGTTLTASTPAHATGAVDVAVNTPAGRATLTGGFTYVPTLTLSSVSATSGSASGGLGVTLSGTALDGITSVTFGGVAGTTVTAVDATTVTLVTPPHIAGVADIVVSDGIQTATLSEAFTYVATAIGQPAYGGLIAAVNGDFNNLIVSLADHSTGINWGGTGTLIGAGAQSNTDGAANTAAIVAQLTGVDGIAVTSYAAGICSEYEIDSQGKTPCAAGNACYNDWFLPAGNNVTASGQLDALQNNRVVLGVDEYEYWSSTEFDDIRAYIEYFRAGAAGDEDTALKDRTTVAVRCVRAFTPF